MAWNFGDILDGITQVLPPDAPALVHGARVVNHGQASTRSNNLARALLARGAKTHDKVAFYMRNRPEYIEALAACFKARLTHVNVNYRYKADEVFYIFDDSDAQTVIYGAEFRDVIVALKERLTKVKSFVEIGEDGSVAPFSENYEKLAGSGGGEPLGIARGDDDMLFLYTGGTTGMPKGVMWRHNDLREAQLLAARALGPVPETLPDLVAAIKTTGPGQVFMPACPLMHGTGLLTAIGNMMSGGCIVTLESAYFDAQELWKVVAQRRVNSIAIVGDAFAKPMLAALDEATVKRDLSSVVTIVSSGVMWSSEVKRGLIGHLPHAMLMDSFGASEGLGFGRSVTTAAGEGKTAKFQIGGLCRVFDENDQPMLAGSGRPGVIALGGPLPLGYYKDPIKTAKTFKMIGGERYSVPGDWCMVEADGTLTLLGRGSVCINTAGEKVYPEEVEEALKTHPSVEDALVVGVPDEKWGQAVTGVVKLVEGSRLDEEGLRKHVRTQLAGYKTPKRILSADIDLRSPNGKADYKGVTDFAKNRLRARTG